MSWREFLILLSGLGAETPLSKIVAIRSEKDPKVVKEMTREQKQIRNEWRKRSFNRKPKAEQKREVDALISAIVGMAGGTYEPN